MSTTILSLERRRRLAAAVLALPLSLAMTGSALAAGSTSELPTSGSAATAAKAAAAATPTKPAKEAKEAKAPGSAAGTGGTYVNGNTNSSKAERPTAPVPGTPSQPLSKADKNGTGANPGPTCTHSYCSTGTGLPTGNGVGDGKAVGQPCAGCVGKADNKNPKGQAPSGPVDRNAGYECDRNQGIGQTNPAHTGCTSDTSGTTSPAPVQSGKKPATKPATKPTAKPTTTPKTPKVNGQGTATMTITVDCRTVTVTSTKDISNMAVFFVDGTSIKIDGLSGTTVTRTFGKDILRATSKSATTTVGAPATGCGALPTDGVTPPAPTCPDGSAMPPGGAKDCVSGSTPGQPAKGGDKITICHATGSSTNPYVVITVDRKGLNGHGDHEGDIIPMPAGGCPLGGTTPGSPATGAAPPVCPTVMPVVGPVPAGCEPQLPPPHGGGDTTTPPTGDQPIGGVTPGQPAVNPPGLNPPGQTTPGLTPPGLNPPVGGLPIGTVTPGQPATAPVAVGPPTGIRPNGTQPQIISGLSSSAAQARTVPGALPFTGTDAMLLTQLGALLLLIGGGVTVAGRRERTARAA